MICMVCKQRFAPWRADHWQYKNGNPFIPPIPDDEKYQEEWQTMYDSDMKMPCSGCSL